MASWNPEERGDGVFRGIIQQFNLGDLFAKIRGEKWVGWVGFELNKKWLD